MHMHFMGQIWSGPFDQRVEWKIRFRIWYSRWRDWSIRRHREWKISEKLMFRILVAMSAKDLPPIHKSLGCALNQTRISGSQSRRSPSELASPGCKLYILLLRIPVCDHVGEIRWICSLKNYSYKSRTTLRVPKGTLGFPKTLVDKLFPYLVNITDLTASMSCIFWFMSWSSNFYNIIPNLYEKVNKIDP